MAADVFLAFGADTGPLEASLARAQAEVRRTADRDAQPRLATWRRPARRWIARWGRASARSASKLSEAKEHVTGFKEELKGAGEGEGFIGGMVEKVKDFLAPLNSLKLGLAEMAEAAAAAFAVEKLYEFVRGMGELGEQTLRAAAMMGTTTEEIGALNYTFTLAGVDIAGAAQAINRFQLGLAQAQDGTGKVAAGLQALGLSAARTRSPEPGEAAREDRRRNLQVRRHADQDRRGRGAGTPVPAIAADPQRGRRRPAQDAGAGGGGRRGPQ